MKRSIILFIVCMILISCNGGNLQPLKQTGTEAIQISFLRDTPPTTITEKDKINIIIDAENVGFSDIKQGVITFSSTNQAIEFLGKTEESLSLKGKSIYSPKGEKTMIQKTALARELPQKSAVTTSLLVSACFNYKTLAQTNVCIDTAQNKQNIKKPCQVSAISLSGGQGGPISISRVEYQMMAHDLEEYVKPQFKIYLSKVGGGNMEIISEDKTAQSCHLDVEQQYKDVVKINANLGEQELKCNTKEINFNEENYIICALEEGVSKTKGTYNSILSLELHYGYKLTINKPITIKRLY